MSGTQDLVVAGGVQNMSQIPIAVGHDGRRSRTGFTDPFSGSTGWVERVRHAGGLAVPGAELIAEKWDISRDDMEAFALREPPAGRAGHGRGPLRAARSSPSSTDADGTDEGIRRDTTLEKMASLQTAGRGRPAHRRGLVSQISDASAALLIASERAVRDHGLTPRARIHHLSVRGDDPIYMLTAPIPATRYAMERSGMSLDDIDVVEINEAFASVVARLASRRPAPTRASRPTRTAAPSRSATRSAPPALG